MRNRDSLTLESLYSFISEGNKETTNYLQNNGADSDTIQLFTKQDDKGKPLFSTDQAIVMFKWIKSDRVKLEDVERDYNDFRKYFPNKNLKDFKNYLDFSEQVHAKVGEKNFQNRNKNISDIDSYGVDKENVIADDEDVLILRADDEHKCVKYGKGYSFCISKPLGGNMYGHYRLSKESTFYFIYFKKVPKENPKHIMVLDRTKNGWEWTFGENSTKVIQGGWNEVIESFPQLEKYADAFVNKPLADEEKKYLEKLRAFASDPTKEQFEQFSPKEKADALKFGMNIPEDLFDSLDKFLRNEYISVGPQIESNIFNKLKDKEKERYTKARIVIMYQQGATSLLDYEIAKNDPVLFDTFILPDLVQGEQETKVYTSYIKDGTTGNIYYNSRYLPLNLPLLRESGDILASNAKELNLPLLRVSGNILAKNAKELNLPSLKMSGSIFASNALQINLPSLEKSGDIYASNAKELNLPRLEKSGAIGASNALQINLPSLEKSGNIFARFAKELNLPSLKMSGDIYANNAKELNLPSLKMSGDIDAPYALQINLPLLRESGNILAKNAKELNLPRLEKSGAINAKNAKELNLPRLEKSGAIDADNALQINLPSLEKSGNIFARFAKELNLPLLRESKVIYASDAKKIIISRAMAKNIFRIPEDCIIIHPEDIKVEESRTPRFKDFIANKYL